MKRSISSVISTIVLLSVAAGAAAVNVRILEANRSETSVLTVQPAAEVVNTTPTSESSATPAPSATEVAAAVAENAPSPLPVPPPMPNGKRVLGSVPGGEHDDDDHDDDHEAREHRDHGLKMRGKFMRLTPQQAGLLRVAALAQVSPSQARDAANGQGSADVLVRVREAAAQIGIPLAEIGAVTDIPPERGRRHGGDDDHEDEGDDDD